MFDHNIFKIILIFLTVAVYIIMVAFNAGAGSGLMKGIFLQSVGNISNKLSTEFTPSGWTFMIWNVIFAWQFLWLGYVVAGICRRSELGWMYLKPDVFPICFYIVWILNNVLTIGWLFLWDREFLIPALVFLGVIALTNHIVLFISYRALYLNGDWLCRQRRVDLWLIRIFLYKTTPKVSELSPEQEVKAHNGIAVYATWTTIACLLNFSVALTYNGGIPNSVSTTVCLSILAFEVVLWYILENFVFDKYVRYTLTVYPVVIVALSGALDKNFQKSSPDGNNIYIAVLLAVVCAIFAIRLVLVIWRHFRQPLYNRTSSKTSFPLA